MGHLDDHLRQPVPSVLLDPPGRHLGAGDPGPRRRRRPRLRELGHETNRCPQPQLLHETPHLHTGQGQERAKRSTVQCVEVL